MRFNRVLGSCLASVPVFAVVACGGDGSSQMQTTSSVTGTPASTTAPAPSVPPVAPPPTTPAVPPPVVNPPAPPPVNPPQPPPVTPPQPPAPPPATTTVSTTSEPDETSAVPTEGDSSAAPSASEGETSAPAQTGGDPGGWQPCKSNPCVILPLGDSITDGVGVDGGGSYRIELFRSALTDNKAITFVGGLKNGPTMVDNVAFPQSHEGHSGWTVKQIDDLLFAANTPPIALSSKPEIVLLHLGTNDMWNGPDGAPGRLGQLIDKLVEELPDSLIAAATIIPWPQNASLVNTYNAGVVTEIQERIDSGKHVIFVDQFEGYPSNQLADGIHPNAEGYKIMAGKWYEAISEYLPTKQ